MRKVKSFGADGQPEAAYRPAFACLAHTEARAISEALAGDIVVSGTRWTVTVWKCRQAADISADDAIRLEDGTIIEIESVVPDRFTITFEGAQRAAVRSGV